MKCLMRGVAVLLCLGATVSVASVAGAADAIASTSTMMWVIDGRNASREDIRLTATAKDRVDNGVLTVEVLAACDLYHPQSFASLNVSDSQGNALFSTEQNLDLIKGTTPITLQWDASSAPNGKYKVQVEVAFSNAVREPSVYTLHVRKVTGEELHALLDKIQAQVADLRKHRPETEPGAQLSWLELRLRISEDFAELAKADLEKGAWRNLADKLDYLERAANSVNALMIFGSCEPEPVATAPDLDLSAITARAGCFYVGERPVFLFGRRVNPATPESIEQLHRYGLNLAAFDLPPNTGGAGSAFAPVFEAAARDNISVTVQLAPQRASVWPGGSGTGAIDPSAAENRAAIERHVAATLPWLAAQKMVLSAAIADRPSFKFAGESVRQAFLARVRALYPERETLNSVWRAHLANYDEITIWDDKAKDYMYQNHRAYQYDWQTFHRGMVDSYFAGLAGLAKQAGPRVLLQVPVSEDVFEPGETRGGVNREALSHAMDIVGVTAGSDSTDPFYAISYPRSSALYALTRSFDPNKPMFNMDGAIAVDPGMTADARQAYVATVLWEAVFSGLDAAALSADTAIFERPETLEAFALTAGNINRLAPIVAAFQQAPADVGILFSDTSKIMDDGIPHLKAARTAYEGCSFAGYKVNFLTEQVIASDALEQYRVVVLPETPAISDRAFDALSAFADKGGSIIRTGTPIPYDEHGRSRHGVIRNTGKTLLVRDFNQSTEYLHEMDAAIMLGYLPSIPRVVNEFNFPLEGVKSRFVECDGKQYLYVLNLRRGSVIAHMVAQGCHTGRDLIVGRNVSFPLQIASMEPMLIQLDPPQAPELTRTVKR